MRRSGVLTWRTRCGRHAIKLPLVLVLPLAFVLFMLCTPFDLLAWTWRRLKDRAKA